MVAVARLPGALRPLTTLGWLHPVPLEGIAGVKRDGVLVAHAVQSDLRPGETSSSGLRDCAGCERLPRAPAGLTNCGFALPRV
jgi:hypothetical protein